MNCLTDEEDPYGEVLDREFFAEKFDHCLDDMRCPKCNGFSRNAKICSLCWPSCLICSRPAKAFGVRICQKCDTELCKQCFYPRSRCQCPKIDFIEIDTIAWANRIADRIDIQRQQLKELLKNG